MPRACPCLPTCHELKVVTTNFTRASVCTAQVTCPRTPTPSTAQRPSRAGRCALWHGQRLAPLVHGFQGLQEQVAAE